MYSTLAGLKNARRATTNLEEMIAVQVAFYAESQRGQGEANCPVRIEELPDVQKKYAA